MAKAKGRGKTKHPRPGAQPSMQRQPVAGAQVSLKKRPVPGPVDTQTSAYLVFGLQLLDHEGSYAWTEISSEHTKLIAEACKGWESMRADDVFAAKGNKPVPFGNLCSAAQARLRNIELEEYDGQWWELRVSGQRRIWGVRQRHVFYIVWWDPEHQVCPSKKKHT
jgi:hypothetical protein